MSALTVILGPIGSIMEFSADIMNVLFNFLILLPDPMGVLLVVAVIFFVLRAIPFF